LYVSASVEHAKHDGSLSVNAIENPIRFIVQLAKGAISQKLKLLGHISAIGKHLQTQTFFVKPGSAVPLPVLSAM
jgi:hypothetical protein